MRENPWAQDAAAPPFVWTDWASYNISDVMQTPVPYSIYASQPSCATSIFFNQMNDEGIGRQKPCGTTDPYRPIIVLPAGMLQSLQPEWASCSADLRGYYDPPKVLTEVASAAGVTLTSAGTTQTVPAMPASVPESAGASQTTPGQQAPTPEPARPNAAPAPASSPDPQPTSATSPGRGTTIDKSIGSIEQPSDAISTSSPGAPPSNIPNGAEPPGPSSPAQSAQPMPASEDPAAVIASIMARPSTASVGPAAGSVQGSPIASPIQAINAASVLEEALSSSTPQKNALPGDPGRVSSSPETAPDPSSLQASQAVFSDTANGPAMTVRVQGSSAIVQADGSAIAIPFGGQATMNGRTISISTSGNIAVVGTSTLALTRAGSAASASTIPEVTIAGISGDPITAALRGSSAVLAAGSLTTTIALGSHVVFDGQSVSVGASGGVIAVGTAVFPLAEDIALDPATSTSAGMTETEDPIASVSRATSAVASGSGSMLRNSASAGSAESTSDGPGAVGSTASNQEPQATATSSEQSAACLEAAPGHLLGLLVALTLTYAFV